MTKYPVVYLVGIGPLRGPGNGAHDWNRTSDLFLTKEVLYRLSYMSDATGGTNRGAAIAMERETGIEPA
jgi:hypothetical protein